jgi:hypothetical protein
MMETSFFGVTGHSLSGATCIYLDALGVSSPSIRRNVRPSTLYLLMAIAIVFRCLSKGYPLLVREVFPQDVVLVEENVAELATGDQESAAFGFASVHHGPGLPLFKSRGALRALAINQVLPAHARIVFGGFNFVLE